MAARAQSPRPGPCPALAVALKAHPKESLVFDAMPPSHQRAYNDAISSAKKPATQQARIEQALKKIAEWGKQRAKK